MPAKTDVALEGRGGGARLGVAANGSWTQEPYERRGEILTENRTEMGGRDSS